MSIYLGQFHSKRDVEENFAVKLPNNINIIVAQYDTPSYEGYAYVLFEKNDLLYEVHGSHCSCNGLEDQWKPERVGLEHLKRSIKHELSTYGSMLTGIIQAYIAEHSDDSFIKLKRAVEKTIKNGQKTSINTEN